MAERIVGEQCVRRDGRRSNTSCPAYSVSGNTRYGATAGLGEYHVNNIDTNHEAYEIYETDHTRITEWRITGGYLATMR